MDQNFMFDDKLRQIESRLSEVEQSLGDPAQLTDGRNLMQLTKTHAELLPIVTTYKEFQKCQKDLADAQTMVTEEVDLALQELAEDEVQILEKKLVELEDDLKFLLIPKDPNDVKNVIIEIRAGTGGEEAGLFAAELFRTYTRFAEKKNWRTEILSSNSTGLRGFKEVVFIVEGHGAYSQLKFEGGTHRVQRVPVTETSGRIHTSAVTVAVLPEAEEVDIAVDPNELRIDTYRSSGPGGQSVNTTDSAVRITHLPTNLVVSCQDEKSQHKNKAKAMKILRSRLLEQVQAEQDAERAQTRRTMVGSGDRSEKIRTYNFPQGRVTDHRINLTLYKLDSTLDGNLEGLVDGLTAADSAEKLKTLSM